MLAKTLLCATMVTTLAAGCAGSSISGRIQARLAPATQLAPVECGACKPEWERAQLWLIKHAAHKLQTTTDVVLRTHAPGNFDTSYGFTVTKEPVGGSMGGYRIVLATACGSLLQSCDPTPSDVQRAFYHYLATGRDLLEGAGALGSIR